MRVPVLFLGLLLVGLAIAAVPAGADDMSDKRTITVSASGEVTVVPDMARITSGVTTEAATAKEALAENSEAMAKVIAGLKEAGIKAEDIQTSSFHVEPRYTHPKEGEASVIDGYRVANQVEVTARDLDRLGEVLDKLVTLGANAVGGLSFMASEAETLRDEARKQAVANALRRAKLFAEAAGAEVGEVLRISEGGGEPGPFPVARMLKAEAVPIERGTETLSASVTVTWELK
jgi:uncharacterized protein YggE